MIETGLFIVVAVLGVSFGAIAFRGAPYVPTLKKDVQKALDMAGLQSGDTIVDLGSGDGRLLKAAAERGLIAVGYELNPFLVLISRWRCRKYKKQTHIYLKDFWSVSLPDDTKVVFVFLAKPFMIKLSRYLQAHVERTQQPITLVSYGFELPGAVPIRQDKAVIFYRINP